MKKNSNQNQGTRPTKDANTTTPATSPNAVAQGLPEFEHDGKKYQFKVPKMNIPGVGVLTASDAATDENAIAYLMTVDCIGSVIDLVID